MPTTDEEQKPDEMLDVPKEFHDVVRVHGRELWAFVMNVGVGGQASNALAQLVEKHRSRSGAHAVGTLAAAFNALANALVMKQGWTSEQVHACDRDTQLAFAAKIQVASNVLVLPTKH